MGCCTVVGICWCCYNLQWYYNRLASVKAESTWANVCPKPRRWIWYYCCFKYGKTWFKRHYHHSVRYARLCLLILLRFRFFVRLIPLHRYKHTHAATCSFTTDLLFFLVARAFIDSIRRITTSFIHSIHLGCIPFSFIQAIKCVSTSMAVFRLQHFFLYTDRVTLTTFNVW